MAYGKVARKSTKPSRGDRRFSLSLLYTYNLELIVLFSSGKN